MVDSYSKKRVDETGVEAWERVNAYTQLDTGYIFWTQLFLKIAFCSHPSARLF